jgi:hypothetical protein
MNSRFGIALCLMLASCKGSGDPPKSSPEASAPDAQPKSSADARPDASAVVSSPSASASESASAPLPADASTTSDDLFVGDAGASACRLAYGPAEQPFRGPAALSVVGQELRLIVNDAGKPRVYPVPITPAPFRRGAAPVVPPRPTSFSGVRWPPCSLAGRFAYCQAPGGSIVRTTVGGTDSKTIAKSRSGTRIAAASVGSDHSVVAFLDMRRTTEGDMLQAFIALDERDPVRLSDDGAGATTLHFLPRGDTPVAVYLDARTAMVPIHARPVSMNGNDLALGNDSVIFVGGAPERGIDFTVARAGAKSFAFVPMPRETTDFGMATLVIEDPPKDDVSASWSRYPNGLDPAPIAAAPARDGTSAWIVRTRPRQKEPGSPRILELGRVDATGSFTALGEIAPGKGVTDLAVIDDGAGVWIVYGDTTITWLERRICSPAGG